MTSFTETTIIDTPRNDVWSVLADIGSIADWNPGLIASRLTTDEATGLGAGRHCDLTPQQWLDERVVEYEPQARITFRIVDSNLPFAFADIRFTLEPSGARTQVTVAPDYKLKYGPIGYVFDRLGGQHMYRKGMRELLRGLKGRVEQSTEH